MTKASSNADQDLIEAIAKLLNEQNLAEIEIEREDLRVRVTRSYASSAVQHVQVQSGNFETCGRVLLGLEPGTAIF